MQIKVNNKNKFPTLIYLQNILSCVGCQHDYGIHYRDDIYLCYSYKKNISRQKIMMLSILQSAIVDELEKSLTSTIEDFAYDKNSKYTNYRSI